MPDETNERPSVAVATYRRHDGQLAWAASLPNGTVVFGAKRFAPIDFAGAVRDSWETLEPLLAQGSGKSGAQADLWVSHPSGTLFAKIQADSLGVEWTGFLSTDQANEEVISAGEMVRAIVLGM